MSIFLYTLYTFTTFVPNYSCISFINPLNNEKSIIIKWLITFSRNR